MIQCQIMQDNRVQCPNPAQFSNEGVDYCRLHFSYAIAKAADAKITMLNPRALVEDDDSELAAMLKLQVDKNKPASIEEEKKGE